MKETSNELGEMYKQCEKVFNLAALSFYNQKEFVIHIGQMLDAHLDDVLHRRSLAQAWLQKLNMFDKNEVGILVNRLIGIEDRADQMEEHIYLLGLKSRYYSQTASELKFELLDLKEMLMSELQEKQAKTKIELLKEALTELMEDI